MKYLITGGAGFIGSHLTDALLGRGDSVIILDNMATGSHKNLAQVADHPNLQIVSGSILDSVVMDQLVSEVDHVLHLAAALGVFNIVNKPLESLMTNIRGTEVVLEAVAKHKKPMLLTSTSEIYGKNSNGPLNEESDRIVGSPLKSRWSYSEAKAIDESFAYFYAQEYGFDIRIVRLFNTVGPRQVGRYGMVVPRFVSAALAGEPLMVYGTGNQSRCFCHVADAVAGILKVIDSNETIGGAFNVGNNKEMSILELAKAVIAETGSSSAIEFLEYEKAYGAGFEDMERRVPDISKMERTVGWVPTRDLATIIGDIATEMRK
jgi:UDP-glucose 4-epimerase